MARLLIITRYHHPVRNGLTDHTALLIDFFRDKFESIDIICEKSDVREETIFREGRILEYRHLRDLFSVISSTMAENRPDVVLFQYVPHMWGRAGVAPIAAVIPFWVRCRFKVSVVSYLHELYYDWSTELKRFLLGLVHRFQLLIIGYSSKTLIVTNFRREQALKHLWTHKVNRIPAGNVSARKDNLRRRTPFVWPYITWYGTLGNDQNIEDLARAFCIVAKEHLNLRLVLVGGFDTSSPRIQAIQSLMIENGVGSRLIVLGFADDDELSDILSGSTVNMLMYASGPSGRRGVVAACLRSGRAIVAVNGKETDPEFKHNQNVLLVSVHDVHALAQAIDRMCNDDELRRILEYGAQELFNAHYSDLIVSKKLGKVLQTPMSTN